MPVPLLKVWFASHFTTLNQLSNVNFSLQNNWTKFGKRVLLVSFVTTATCTVLSHWPLKSILQCKLLLKCNYWNVFKDDYIKVTFLKIGIQLLTASHLQFLAQTCWPGKTFIINHKSLINDLLLLLINTIKIFLL